MKKRGECFVCFKKDAEYWKMIDSKIIFYHHWCVPSRVGISPLDFYKEVMYFREYNAKRAKT